MKRMRRFDLLLQALITHGLSAFVSQTFRTYKIHVQVFKKWIDDDNIFSCHAPRFRRGCVVVENSTNTPRSL